MSEPQIGIKQTQASWTVWSYWRKVSSNWKEALKSTRVSEETLAPPWWNTRQSIATLTLSKNLCKSWDFYSWSPQVIFGWHEERPTWLHMSSRHLKGSRESTPQTYSCCKQHLWPVTCFWEADTLSPGEVYAIDVAWYTSMISICTCSGISLTSGDHHARNIGIDSYDWYQHQPPWTHLYQLRVRIPSTNWNPNRVIHKTLIAFIISIIRKQVTTSPVDIDMYSFGPSVTNFNSLSAASADVRLSRWIRGRSYIPINRRATNVCECRWGPLLPKE